MTAQSAYILIMQEHNNGKLWKVSHCFDLYLMLSWNWLPGTEFASPVILLTLQIRKLQLFAIKLQAITAGDLCGVLELLVLPFKIDALLASTSWNNLGG
jgi:hypothetical protein